jgi:hypothetical protein
MKTNDSQSNISLERVSQILDRFLMVENREMMTKGLIQTNIQKGLQIYVRSNDHNPPHFHIESTQRHYHQKFTIEGIDNISTTVDSRFDSYIKKFFRQNSKFKEVIEKEFYRLNPDLSI